LDENKIQNILLNLWDSISGNKIKDIFGSDIKVPKIPKRVFEGIWDNNRNFQLNTLYDKIQNEDSYVKVSNGIIDILNENLDKLLENNISGIVNKELQKLEPKEINEMVHDFMGKEMKAINPALTEKTKNEICKYLIDAIVNAIGYNFSGLINTVDISNVVFYMEK